MEVLIIVIDLGFYIFKAGYFTEDLKEYYMRFVYYVYKGYKFYFNEEGE